MGRCSRQTSASHKSTTLSKGNRFCCLFGFMTQAWMWALGKCVRHGRWTRPLLVDAGVAWWVKHRRSDHPLYFPVRRGGGWMVWEGYLSVSVYMHRADVCLVHASTCVKVCMIAFMQRRCEWGLMAAMSLSFPPLCLLLQHKQRPTASQVSW